MEEITAIRRRVAEAKSAAAALRRENGEGSDNKDDGEAKEGGPRDVDMDVDDGAVRKQEDRPGGTEDGDDAVEY